MPPFRDLIALWLGKFVSNILKLRGTGGSALPGLVVEKIAPHFLHNLLANKKIILITGTNGKTTTARLTSSVLKNEVIHNRTGSNLIRGQISAVIKQVNWLGKTTHKNVVLETDEAVLPLLLSEIKPEYIVLTNLFRDQLDRYGEIDNTVRKWLTALENTPYKTNLIINADDPYLSGLAQKLKNIHRVVYFGLADTHYGQKEPFQFADAVMKDESEELHYTHYYISHLGHYAGRPHPDYLVDHIHIEEDASRFTIQYPQDNNDKTDNIEINLRLPGLYNIYNALAVFALADQMKVDTSQMLETFSSETNIFGRGEKIELNSHNLRIYLIKNPAGATEILRTIKPFFTQKKTNLLIAANDHFADGTDVSWYWDTPFEILRNTPINELVFSGTRANDMALRLKYALIESTYSPESDLIKGAMIEPSINAIFPYIQSCKSDWVIIATYTASLEIQKALSRYGLKDKYWKE